jgi:serine/threonine protein kinase/tetratricopeptide (TPR) repeat protein
MASGDWTRIRRIFHDALDRPSAERDVFIRAECADDPSVLESVLELLAEHSDSPSQSVSRLPRAYGPSVFKEGEIVAGRFHILRFIARGGMGEVYEAEDLRLAKRRYALKTLRAELSVTEDALNRFRREILIAKDLAHDNLCRVHDLVEFETPDPADPAKRRVVPCLSMELVRGENLADYLRRNRPIAPEQALPIARQVAAGLGALHERGVVHRDLKPSNIMLTPRRSGGDRVVLMDFGLAKMDSDAELYESRFQLHAGAPYFMAPELFEGGRPGIASDLYAFGLVLDEMVTRKRVLAAASVQALVFAKLHESPTAPSERADALPEAWNAAILRCLHPDPQSRFSSASEVIDALQAADPVAVAPQRPVLLPTVPLPPPAERLARRKVLFMSVAVPVVLAVGAVGSIAIPESGFTVHIFDFENHARPELAYICAGATSELARRLASLPNLRVFRTYSIRSAATKLRASSGFSVDGILQEQAGQTRLSVTIVNDSDGSVVWGDALDRVISSSAFELESDVAGRILEMLRAKLVERENHDWLHAAKRALNLRGAGPQLSVAPTTNNNAMGRYMLARYLLEQPSAPKIRSGIVALHEAVLDDPHFALAWSALADANLMLMAYVTGPSEGLLDQARSAAETAVRIDPQLAEAHASIAAVRQQSLDWGDAEASYLEALRIKPRFSRAHRWYAGLVLQFGRFDEALAHARLAVEQDPYDQLGVMSTGLYLLFAGKVREAIAVLEPAVKGKEVEGVRHNLGQAYARMAQFTHDPDRREWLRKALEQAAVVAEIEQSNGQLRPLLSDRMYALFHSIAGDFAAAEPHVRRLKDDVQAGRLSPVDLASIYSMQHNYGPALDLLESAYAAHDRGLMYMKVYPFLENLRGQPRFERLIRQVGL